MKELTPLLAAKMEGVELEISRSRDAPLSPTGGAIADRSSRVYDLPPGGQYQQQQGGDVARTIPIRRLVEEVSVGVLFFSKK